MFKSKHHNYQKGQSFVELSISLVVLLLMLSGLLDLGRIYFIFVALEDGAGEAALFLSINPECPKASSGPTCTDPNNAEYRARNAGGEVVDWAGAAITVNVPDLHGVGDPVSVSIEYSFSLLTPIIPRVVGVNPITLKAEASQIILTES